jgi:hypothetical protein
MTIGQSEMHNLIANGRPKYRFAGTVVEPLRTEGVFAGMIRIKWFLDADHEQTDWTLERFIK